MGKGRRRGQQVRASERGRRRTSAAGLRRRISEDSLEILGEGD